MLLGERNLCTGMTTVQILLIIYLVLINLAGFITAFADKRRARRSAWRVPEKAFLWLAAIGGGLGVLAGFFAFRHKTKHIGLMLGVLALALLFYGLLIFAVFNMRHHANPFAG